jgi:phage tail-like protein
MANGTPGTDAQPQPAGVGQIVDPYRNYNFRLEIRGITEAGFTECSGLGMRIHTILYGVGGTAQAVRKIPGAVEYADVTLRYGLTRSRQLWDWLALVARGQVERRNVSIVVLEPNGSDEGLRWNLYNAFPCEWSCTPFDALGREAAIEQMKLAFDSLDRA